MAILSTIVIPWELIGRLAVQTAKRLLNGEQVSSPVLVPPQAVITRRSTDTVAVDDSDVAEALKFVRQHAVEPIGIPDILKRIPVARRTLELKFRRVLGRTILEEIHRVRVERTKVLLTTTDLTLADIARQCGYSSPTMLGINFRSLAGITPGEYRRRFSSRSPMA